MRKPTPTASIDLVGEEAWARPTISLCPRPGRVLGTRYRVLCTDTGSTKIGRVMILGNRQNFVGLENG